MILTDCGNKTTAEQEQITQNEATSPMNYGDEGPQYLDKNGTPVLQVLSEGEGDITIKVVKTDSVYTLKTADAGKTFENTEDYFLHSEKGQVRFGKKDSVYYSDLNRQKQ
ncbi:hypothetical protein F0358_13160 [Empedobacter brevis]|uniref:hypothetical protein n=1 Tax=Empedobacter brevis TaxID=247 RepID=UPI00123CA856|nr:hypothetical protein [Empedobacter brevis]QES93602.1 hypothetical protein F0358_13160 [Empedobacter brevis]